MAEREKGRVMEGETKTDKRKKGETTDRENPNDMEMIVPAAYGTKHFHPVICSWLMSRRGRFKPEHAEAS